MSASLDGIYNPIRWEQVTQGMLWPMVLKAHDRIRQVDSLRQWTLEHREAIQSLAMAMEQFIQRSVAPINHDIFTFLEEQYPPLRKVPLPLRSLSVDQQSTFLYFFSCYTMLHVLPFLSTCAMSRLSPFSCFVLDHYLSLFTSLIISHSLTLVILFSLTLLASST